MTQRYDNQIKQIGKDLDQIVGYNSKISPIHELLLLFRKNMHG